jgi:hypothetical protein
MEEVTEACIDSTIHSNELQAVCEHITRKLIEGVHHGFFEMHVKVETTQSKRRSITIICGNSRRFVVRS